MSEKNDKSDCDNENNGNDKDLNDLKKLVKIYHLGVPIIALLILCFYFGWFFSQEHVLSSKSGDWGAFGDFVGGILNPIIAFCAFYWLTKSVLVQKEELAATTDALKSSSDSQDELSKAQNAVISEMQHDRYTETVKLVMNTYTVRLEAMYAYRNIVYKQGLVAGHSAYVTHKDGQKLPISEILGLCEKEILKERGNLDEHIIFLQNPESDLLRIDRQP